MYAESLGIPNPSQPIEQAAQWVQWAMAGVGTKEAETRYNLDQFWKAKAAYYPSASPEEIGQLERLDTFAHGVWDALETGKIFSSSPSYWEFWKKYWTGGNPSNPESLTAATAAAAAEAGQAAAAQRAAAATPTQATFGAGLANLAAQNQRNLPGIVNSAQSQWTQTGVSPLGIPLWGWIAGAGLLGLLFLTRD